MHPARAIRHFVEIMDERAQTLSAIDSILNELGAEHVLIGGLAVGYHGRERATLDVDMLVHRRKLKPIATTVRAAGYEAILTKDMVRVTPRGGDPKTESVADLLAEEANPVLRAAFKEAELASVLGHRVNVVRRGALVALKFHSAMSRTRAIEDKYQDVADVGRIVARKFTESDARMARRIAGLSYPGAETDFRQMLDDLKHGRAVRL